MICNFGVLDDALEITQNIYLLFSTHTLQYFLQLVFILSVNNALSKHLRLNVLKSQCSFIKGTALNNLNILVTNDRLHCVIRLVLDDFFKRRQIF